MRQKFTGFLQDIEAAHAPRSVISPDEPAEAAEALSHGSWLERGGYRLRSNTLKLALSTLAVLSLLAPVASADDHEYYVRVDPHVPNAAPGDPGEDCAASDANRPSTAVESAQHLLGQVDPAPLLQGRVSAQPLVPTCIAVGQEIPDRSTCQASTCPDLPCGRTFCVCVNCFATLRTHVVVYAAYNVTSGHFVFWPGPAPPASGDSGGDAEFDCIECPPDWIVTQIVE